MFMFSVQDVYAFVVCDHILCIAIAGKSWQIGSQVLAYEGMDQIPSDEVVKLSPKLATGWSLAGL
jgi:hypothetical protein